MKKLIGRFLDVDELYSDLYSNTEPPSKYYHQETIELLSIYYCVKEIKHTTKGLFFNNKKVLKDANYRVCGFVNGGLALIDMDTRTMWYFTGESFVSSNHVTDLVSCVDTDEMFDAVEGFGDVVCTEGGLRCLRDY